MASVIEKHCSTRLRIKNIQERASLNVYLRNYSSKEELIFIFGEFQSKMKFQPCCLCHKGNLPVAINSDEETPFVGGEKCTSSYRHIMRMCCRAYNYTKNNN